MEFMAKTPRFVTVNHLLLLGLFMAVIFPVTVGSAVLWVVADAATREVSWPRKWVSVIFLAYPLFPLLLLFLRVRYERVHTPGMKHNVVRNIAIGSIIVPIIAVVMSPPSLTIQVFSWTFALLLVIGGSYLYEWL